MDGRELKEIWRSGIPSFGAWITLNDPAAAAVVCNLGYEWVLVDAEHQPFSAETLREIFAVVRSRGSVPIVRVRDNDAALIKQMLDFGAEGIMVPMAQSVEDARRAAAACRYPPQGVRGFNPRDASNFFKDLDYYAQTINDRVIALLQVEHIDAVHNLDGILATPGLDAILIGPADLTYSMGLPLQNEHPKVQEAIQSVITKCNAAHVPVGIAVYGAADEFIAWLQRGINFITLGFDYGWINEAGGAVLRRMREATGGR